MIDEPPQGKGVGLVANMPIGDPGELAEAGDSAGLGHARQTVPTARSSDAAAGPP